MRVVLATYNIHRCVGQDGRYDPDRILRVLRELRANVIALQEVDSRKHRGLELLRCLATELGYTSLAGPTLLRQDGHYGNAILTNLEITRVERLDLSVPGREPRGALDVDLDCEGLTLRIVATHLGLWPADRRLQIERLLKLFKPDGRWYPGVLMGDLNEWVLWGRPMRRLQRLFGKAPAIRTFPAKLPIFALDRIWAHPRTMLVSLAVHKTSVSRIASDHLPLKGVIRVTSAVPAGTRLDPVTTTETPRSRRGVSSPAGALFLE